MGICKTPRTVKIWKWKVESLFLLMCFGYYYIICQGHLIWTKTVHIFNFFFILNLLSSTSWDFRLWIIYLAHQIQQLIMKLRNQKITNFLTKSPVCLTGLDGNSIGFTIVLPIENHCSSNRKQTLVFSFIKLTKVVNILLTGYNN